MVKSAMVLPIIQIGDPRLLQPSEEITNFADPKLEKLIEDLIDTCESDRDKTAGIAAVQVGKNIQLTIVRRVDIEERQGRNKKRKGATTRPLRDKTQATAEQEGLINAADPSTILKGRAVWQPLLNPKITKVIGSQESLRWEACLSIGVGKSQLWAPVWRPEKIEVSYQTPSGEHRKLQADGFFARLLQHEIDHLNGILFLSRVNNPEANIWRNEALDEYLETHPSYPEEK